MFDLYALWLSYWLTYYQLFYQDLAALQNDLNIQKGRINEHERRLISQGL